MKLIAGLGNPGPKYANTRHNAGFWVIDELARRYNAPCVKTKWDALYSETMIGREKVILLQPQTFMNLSGESIAQAVDYFDTLEPETDCIVIYDDMDFPPGVVKLRQRGSAGGHNGMKSIIQRLGTDAFLRVRLGIGRPEPPLEVINYVLGTFPEEHRTAVEQMVVRAADAVEYAVKMSFEKAMNRFNDNTGTN